MDHTFRISIVHLTCLLSLFNFFKDFIYLILERGREGERKGDKHQCVVFSLMPPTGDLAHNPGMWPDWELNQRPFGSQASIQSTEAHQPGLIFFLMYYISLAILEVYCQRLSDWSIKNFYQSVSFSDLKHFEFLPSIRFKLSFLWCW